MLSPDSENLLDWSCEEYDGEGWNEVDIFCSIYEVSEDKKGFRIELVVVLLEVLDWFNLVIWLW